MTKLVILLSFALFFCVVVAQEKPPSESDELIAICKSVNDPKQPKEVKSRGKECNDILHHILAGKGKKEDNVKIRFMQGVDALSAFSSQVTPAMNSFKNHLTEEQYAIMLKINQLTRESVMKFKQAVDEFNAALEKEGNNDRFKEVDALITRAGACLFEIQTELDEKFAPKNRIPPELHDAIESGVEFMTAVSRIKKGISEF